MITKETFTFLPEGRREALRAFLDGHGLALETDLTYTVLCYDGAALVATGSLSQNVLKCLLVEEAYRGEGLLTDIVTELTAHAFACGEPHLFACTAPRNRGVLEGLGFFPIAETRDILFLENAPRGFERYLSALPRAPQTGTVGAVVANANPFTLGHLYLVEEAARRCGLLYLFILSEDRSEFPFAARYAMAQRAVAHIPNVTVAESGPYMISAATLPTYFIKDTAAAQSASYDLDLTVFAAIAGALRITNRYVGTEPYSPFTLGYNARMKELLPGLGIRVTELPRAAAAGAAISASRVRELLSGGRFSEIRELVPPSTYDFLLSMRK